MKRIQFNIKLPQSHINRINVLRGELTQSELIMRLVDEAWAREEMMKSLNVVQNLSIGSL